MRNIIKLAKTNDYKNIVVTAGILRMLKNKIVQLFNDDEARKASEMLIATKEIKPALSEVYEYAEKVEKAISDLDANDYNRNVLYLKDRISNLNRLLGKVKDLEIARIINKDRPVSRNAPVSEDIAAVYKLQQPLKDSGVDFSNIEINYDTIVYLKNSISEKASSKGFVYDFEAIPNETFKSAIYSQIPNMTVTKVTGPELNLVDSVYGQKDTPKRGSIANVVVESDFIQLPATVPVLVKVKFILLDKRKNVDSPMKLKLAKQFVSEVKTMDKRSNSIHSIVKNAIKQNLDTERLIQSKETYYIEDSRKLYNNIINGIDVDYKNLCLKTEVYNKASQFKSSFVIYKLESNDSFEVMNPLVFGVTRNDCKLIYNTYKEAVNHITDELMKVASKLEGKHSDLAEFLSLPIKALNNKDLYGLSKTCQVNQNAYKQAQTLELNNPDKIAKFQNLIK